ncbi:MAG TPA: tetratricopeptide repeat protein [Vicinamibacterales bacterium]|nr:tetratricopeptide repeat protein [Vicinamibacterales bacterium]
MRTTRTSTICVGIILFLASAVSAQDWRGMGRLAGKVVDETGAPIEGVTVKGVRGESNGGPIVKTNKKGEWVLAGINGGAWNLDFDKPGYEPVKKSAAFQEHDSNPAMTVTMKKAAVDPNVQIRADLEKAADLVKQQKFADARAIYQNILAQHPDAYQIEPYIARTYYAEHQLDPAIEHLKIAAAKDPNNVEIKLLLATVLNEKGSTDDARQILASIDESKVTDPATFVNAGIGLINQKKPEDALTWFDKAIARFPQSADAYYYRGITQLQLGKNDAAKADLEKFVAMAPNAPEAATAKGILEKLK